MLVCRSWVICQWRWWSWYWWEHSGSSTSLTLTTVMTTAVHGSPASLDILRVELSLCCRQSAGTGVTHWPAGQTHQLVTGSNTNWPSSFNVSLFTSHIPRRVFPQSLKVIDNHFIWVTWRGHAHLGMMCHRLEVSRYKPYHDNMKGSKACRI